MQTSITAHDPDTDYVEIVVGAECDFAHRATLRCADVDIVELLEPGWIFEIAEQRQTVTPALFVGPCKSGIAWQGKSPRGQRQCYRGEERSAVHSGDPMRLAALEGARDEPDTMTTSSHSEGFRSKRGLLPDELLHLQAANGLAPTNPVAEEVCQRICAYLMTLPLQLRINHGSRLATLFSLWGD